MQQKQANMYTIKVEKCSLESNSQEEGTILFSLAQLRATLYSKNKTQNKKLWGLPGKDIITGAIFT